MRVFRYVVADVFTDEPLAGNPVAVFTDARGLETDEMQRLARELNLSESVFVLPPEQGGHARIRIFTPGIEMQFAGHPTLGTAFVLAAPMQLLEIRLETGAGIDALSGDTLNAQTNEVAMEGAGARGGQTKFDRMRALGDRSNTEQLDQLLLRRGPEPPRESAHDGLPNNPCGLNVSTSARSTNVSTGEYCPQQSEDVTGR